MKKFVPESLRIFTFTATAATLHRYYNNYAEEPLKNKLKESLLEKKILESELNSATLEYDKHKVKVQSFADRLDDVKKSIDEERSFIPDIIDPNNNTGVSQCKPHFENIIKESEKGYKIIKEFMDWVYNSNNGNKCSNNPSSWIDSFKEFLNEWNAFISTLTLEQLGALAHLLSAISIFFCLSSIITIIYSNMLLNYFKIEEKFPRLARYIRIRQKFQQYYLFINFLIIILILLALIFINYTVLTSR